MQQQDLLRVTGKLFVNFASYQLSKLPSLDGLKAVQRRILYVLRNYNNWTKSARVVGEVIAKYHPHGDGSVYDSLVNLACRKLVQFRGNIGSCGRTIEPIKPAAYRYTEVKRQNQFDEINEMYELLPYTFRAINELGEEEPVLLPAKYPLTMLFLGVSIKPDQTIAVGTSTALPVLEKQSMNDFIRQFIDLSKEKLLRIDSYDKIFNTLVTLTNNAGKLSKLPKLRAKFSSLQVNEVLLEPTVISKSLDIQFAVQEQGNAILFREITQKLKDFVVNREKYERYFESLSRIRVIDATRDEPQILLKSSNERDLQVAKELFSKDKYAIYLSISLPKPQVIGNEEYALNYVTIQMPLGALLIGNFLVYLNAQRQLRKTKLERILAKIRELEVIEYIRKHLQRLRNWDIVPEDFAKQIANESFTQNEILDVLQKYPIKKLLTVNTDRSKLQDDARQIQMELDNLLSIMYDNYSN